MSVAEIVTTDYITKMFYLIETQMETVRYREIEKDIWKQAKIQADLDKLYMT